MINFRYTCSVVIFIGLGKNGKIKRFIKFYSRKHSRMSYCFPFSITTFYYIILLYKYIYNYIIIFILYFEEVANTSKTHTQFKTRVHKPHPISDQNG